MIPSVPPTPEIKPLDILKPPPGITSEAVMMYGLHEGNIEEGRELSAQLAKRDAIAEAKKIAGEAARTAFIGALAERGYRLKKGAKIPPDRCVEQPKDDTPPHIREAEKKLTRLVIDAKECVRLGWSIAEIQRRVGECMK